MHYNDLGDKEFDCHIRLVEQIDKDLYSVVPLVVDQSNVVQDWKTYEIFLLSSWIYELRMKTWKEWLCFFLITTHNVSIKCMQLPEFRSFL